MSVRFTSGMKPFQVVILGIFGFFAVVGVIVFATFKGPGGGAEQVPVTLWGTVPSEVMHEVLTEYNSAAADTDELFIIYREIREEVFDSELVEALAEGRGPDLILLGHDSIIRHREKLSVIPFDSYPERDFKDNFIELGELYRVPGGVIGLPFEVDPMVLYWNRDILASSGYAAPPATWEELLPMVPNLTERDAQNTITRSAIALGEFQNISHAKDILTLLFMQAGDPIITQDSTGDVDVVFGNRFGLPEIPAESALRFYTEFANPVRTLYSWNRSLPSSKEAFLAGDVALYLGFASEAEELKLRNPNLNFDVTMVPQADSTGTKRTVGAMEALGLVRASPNTTAAYRSMLLMTGPLFQRVFSNAYGLPPVRRDLLSDSAPNATIQIFFDSALISRGFLDPDRTQTTLIFRSMVEDITSGRESISKSILDTRAALGALVK